MEMCPKGRSWRTRKNHWSLPLSDGEAATVIFRTTCGETSLSIRGASGTGTGPFEVILLNSIRWTRLFFVASSLHP